MSIESFFAGIGGWFKKEEASISKVLNRIEPLIKEAEPIVAKLALVAAGVAAGAPTSALLAHVAGFLSTAVTDTNKVDTFVTDNQNVPFPTLMHNAAVVAIKALPVAGGAIVSDIDTAVQLAYSSVKQQTTPPVEAKVEAKPVA